MICTKKMKTNITDKIKTFKKEPKKMLFSYKNKIYRLEPEAYNRAFDIRDSLETMTLGDAFREIENHS